LYHDSGHWHDPSFSRLMPTPNWFVTHCLSIVSVTPLDLAILSAGNLFESRVFHELRKLIVYGGRYPKAARITTPFVCLEAAGATPPLQ